MPPINIPDEILGDNNPGDLLGVLGILNSLKLPPFGRPKSGLADPIGESSGYFWSILPWSLPPDALKKPEALQKYAEWTDITKVTEVLQKEAPIRLALQNQPLWTSTADLIYCLASGEAFHTSSIFLGLPGARDWDPWPSPVPVGFVPGRASETLQSRLQSDTDHGIWSGSKAILLPPGTPHRNALMVAPLWERESGDIFPYLFDLRCRLLLILGSANADAERMLDHALRSGAGAAAFVAIAEPMAADFVSEILSQMPNGRGVDEAIFSAAKWAGAPYPIIVGTPFRLQTRRGKLGRFWIPRFDFSSYPGGETMHLETAPPGEEDFPAPESPASALPPPDVPAPPPPARDRPPGLPPVPPRKSDTVFIVPPAFEGFDPILRSPASRGLESTARDLSGAEPPPVERPNRFLQCQVRKAGAELETGAFLAGAEYSLRIRIGHPSLDWLQSRANVPFPQEELPPGLGKYTLTVVFLPVSRTDILKFGEGAAERQTIELREEGGNSTEANIPFVVPEEGDTFDRRVFVLYENRILQTGRLRGPVVRPGAEAPAEKIRFDIEAVVSAQFSRLGSKTRFGHTFFVNADEGSESRITSVSKPGVELLSPEGLPDKVKNLENLISGIAYEDKNSSGKLDENKDLLRTMIRLAQAGADLRDILNKNDRLTRGLPPGSAVQILTRIDGAKLPIEFFYDHRVPKKEAKLCPGAQTFLERGSCPEEHGRDVFCPSGFWGLNRVIERHAIPPEREPSPDFTLLSEPMENRDRLPLRTRALFGGTDKVDKSLGAAHGLALIKAQLRTTTGSEARQALDWQEWETAMKADTPRLLVLVVHTDVEDGEQTMEIGSDQWLSYYEIDRDHAGGEPPPGSILFLIGCQTNSPKIAYESLAEKFRRKGAAVVVSSNATLHARHAVPVVEKLLEELRVQTEGSAGTGFGTIMQNARRKLLAAGVPVVLCITAIGDADWLIKN